jgi:hypothetical protein
MRHANALLYPSRTPTDAHNLASVRTPGQLTGIRAWRIECAGSYGSEGWGVRIPSSVPAQAHVNQVVDLGFCVSWACSFPTRPAAPAS